MEQQQTSPQPPVLSSVEGPATLAAVRHDGWTGERMATFCEALAETAVVAEACDAARMGISGAYAARRRNAVFAAAWDAALTIARERLADTLLARSMEGNIERIYKDGELVGERHVLDNRLGLAILRRLDRLAEGGVSVSARDLPFSGECRSPSVRHGAFNWEHAIEAMRAGDDEGVAQALALVQSNEVEEVEALRGAQGEEEEDEEFDELSDAPLGTERVWLEVDGAWWTDFPPPDDFTGKEEGSWGDDDYSRQCTPDESDLLSAARDAELKEMKDEEEAERTDFFAGLRSEVEAAPHPVPSEAAGGIVQDSLDPGPTSDFAHEDTKER